jgi:flagella basal body P-ring formation protein FlgA
MAIEDGYIGDRIRVRNQESGEIIYATVIDVGLVEIVQ